MRFLARVAVDERNSCRACFRRSRTASPSRTRSIYLCRSHGRGVRLQGDCDHERDRQSLIDGKVRDEFRNLGRFHDLTLDSPTSRPPNSSWSSPPSFMSTGILPRYPPRKSSNESITLLPLSDAITQHP